MRLSRIAIPAAALLIAAALCVITAFFSVRLVEDSSISGVEEALDIAELDWADVDVNGLQVFLIGEAPDEAARFQAVTVAGTVVDSARVIDQMLVAEAADIRPPAFSVEILRNDDGISVIGLIPASTDREDMLSRFEDIAGRDGEVADLLEVADFPAPDGWEPALSFALRSLSDLPRSKLSISAEAVAIKAMTESEADRRKLLSNLERRAPEGLELALDLSAPRPVITPFTLRFLIDETGRAHFDACSADTEASRDAILAAAQAAGATEDETCRLGLGVPSRRWADAAVQAISAVSELGGGSVTFSNADIALLALEGTDQGLFDRVVGELETGLPEVFALKAVLPETPDAKDEGPREFTATLSPEGSVQLRGRVRSEIARQTADSLARALFTSASVYTAARVDETLPANWSPRVLAGLEALGGLSNGVVRVTPDLVSLSGNTGNPDAEDEISGLLADKLGEAGEFEISVTYQEKLDPTLGIPTPEECEAQIVEIIGDRKINFEPGSANLDASAKDVMDDIAELLKLCGDIPLEIQGHTDSQGRESMNEQLSQDRAQAVLDALRNRRVLTASYRVKGYGEMQPIADNGTEEGREANRRIAFRLIRPEPVEEEKTALEELEEAAAEGDTEVPEAEQGTGE
ncbi:OmpA family protein [Salipiger bermudensis]|uniref:OmpA domain protein n=1 Tax=Salipiger bermudensis (strain DSM 26914 / JCM 13377 / KCTC 12554 / HTCC2601) TaxID=314265 RepID=Q0FRV4_SALBH|nr:OmpA family protein [Salipiger bermudensis]EAU47005.1 OmpA domain protein [Salipiger bermudensis HTCC2601]